MCWTAISEINIAWTICLSHTSMPGFPVEDTAAFPGDGKRRVMTSSAWPTGTGVLFWLVFRCSFFSLSLYLLNFGTRGDGEEKHGRLQALLCHCQENAHFAPVLTLHKPEGKDALLANFSLHQHSFHSKAQNNKSSKVLWKGFSNFDAKDPNISFPHEKHAKSFLWLIQFKFICIAFLCSF